MLKVILLITPANHCINMPLARAQSIHWIILILFAVFLISCTTTTVHVNTRYLNTQSAQTIKQQLESHGLAVQLNEHPFPSDISATSIITSPFIEDRHALNNVTFVMSKLGFEVEVTNTLVNANHWYTKNTIGLYVVPMDISPQEGKNMTDLAHAYQTSKCENNAMLIMTKTGQFRYGSGQDLLTGKWSITEFPYILFENKTPYIYAYFEVHREKMRDNIGPLDLITLTPLSPSSFGDSCTFIYGVRE